MIQTLIHRIFKPRLIALFIKEMQQILRDKQLLSLLLIPPTVQLVVYGYALSPEVEHLRLGVIDLSNSPISRNITAELVDNHVFDLLASGGTQRSLAQEVRNGQLDAGIILPPELERTVNEDRSSPVQVLLDGVDANSAGIASGYVSQILLNFNKHLPENAHEKPQAIKPDVSFAYNPGLISSWFFAPGVIGLVLNLAGTLVSSTALIREKDSGTLEQLLMTPVESADILIAKIAPLVVLLTGNFLFSLTVAKILFNVPFRGNFFLLLAIAILYIFVAISLGILLATFCQNQRQSILTSFFFNLPLIQLSGAVSPIETMPEFWKFLSLFNPLRYFIFCIRSIMLKGVGIDVLWPSILALAIFALAFLTISASKFREQLK